MEVAWCLRRLEVLRLCRSSFGGHCTRSRNNRVLRRCVQTSTQDTETNTPLHGIKVLDLSRILAGPYCTMLMADLGADVLKIERPGTGCDTRSWGPPFIGKESAYFLSVNRNKKSVCVDLKKPDGVKIIKDLAKSCDVLLENYLPGKLSTMGLGYEDLKTVAPHLVYCSISGYGQTGPYQSRAGYDVIAAGMGGLIHITGPRDGAPCKVGVAMTDLSTGLYAFSAILVALMHRQKTGRGQHIDCNLLSTQVASLVNIASNYLNAGMEATRYGTAHESIVPYQAFRTEDGYLLVGAGNNSQFKQLCQFMSLSEMSEDPRFSNNKQRVANRDILLSMLGNRFQEKTTREWMDVLEGSGIPYGPINNMEQVFSDPQVIHNNMIQEMVHPTAGVIRQPGPPVKYSEAENVTPCAPPTLGQHTQEVLQGIMGYSPTQIEQLMKDGVVQ